MARKPHLAPVPTVQSEHKMAKTKIINEAIEIIQSLPHGGAAAEVLKHLIARKFPSQRWFEPKSLEYAFAEKLYENRRWLMPTGTSSDRQKEPSQRQLPPETTFLGIVLSKALEVSVVETIESKTTLREYHRPMAILPQGSLFGTFETADLMCQTQPIQNYTVFSGLRTFFFSDPRLDSQVVGTTAYQRAIHDLAPTTSKFQGWQQGDTFPPTQTPLFLLQAFLGEKLQTWKSRVLVIPHRLPVPRLR
jgi:hypothetical protein